MERMFFMLNKKMRTKVISIMMFTILILLCSNFSYSQGLIFNGKRNKIGFDFGYGGQNLNMLLDKISPNDAASIRNYFISIGINPDSAGLAVSYNYKVYFFQFQYYYSFLRKKTWGIDLLVQPQYNITKFRETDNTVEQKKGYETGLNVGVLARKNVWKDFLSFYLLISAGPHYVSGTLERQSKGFIFSDNLSVGINMKLAKRLYLDIRPGFRHISNAGLKQPNRGINTITLNGGFFIAL